MQIFYIRTCNSNFVSRDDGNEYERPDEALAKGLQAAALIASDEIREGTASAAVEVRIEAATGDVVLRSVLSLSVSPLFFTLGDPEVQLT